MSAEHMDLCDVRRYGSAAYYKYSPLPTPMPLLSSDVTSDKQTSLAEMYEAELTHMKHALCHTQAHEEESSSLAEANTQTTGMMNEAQSVLMQEAQAALCDEGKTKKKKQQQQQSNPSAAAQEMVTAFLLEGSAQMGGRTYSGYPIYGPRSAEQRLQAVHRIFAETLQVTTHAPVSAKPPEPRAEHAALPLAHMYSSEDEVCCNKTQPAQNKGEGEGGENDDDVCETREQYWRRLARHYITHSSNNNSNNNGASEEAVAAAIDKTKDASPLQLPTQPNSHPATTAHTMSSATMKKEKCAYEPEDAFYLIDLGRVVEQMARWRRALPMVRPHYAVKCNPNLAIMQTLAALGAGFDCASKAEIELVLQNHLVASADEIIFANPCKQPGDLRAASHYGVTYVTFDSGAELEKIARHMPHARAVLRISTNDSQAVCAFSSKFGAPLEQVPALLCKARALGLEIYGVSFHVGSGNNDTAAYVQAVREAHWVFAQAAAHGFNCTLLDIGGGYPGVPPEPSQSPAGQTNEAEEMIGFEEIAAALRPVLCELFPDTTIIAEPGRFFTAATHALVMNVFGKRVLRMSEAEKVQYQARYPHLALDAAEEHQYYVNDGLYHSFNCVLYDHAHPTLLLLDDGDGAMATEAAEKNSLHSHLMNNNKTDNNNNKKQEEEDEEGKEHEVCTEHMTMTTTVTPQSPGSPSSTSGFFASENTHVHHTGEETMGGCGGEESVDERAGNTQKACDGAESEEERQRLRDPWCRRRLCPPRPLRLSTIFGPTCDSLDCILKKAPFPEMHIGDWVLVPDMGSYTTAAGCAFNGFATRRVEWVSSIVL